MLVDRSSNLSMLPVLLWLVGLVLAQDSTDNPAGTPLYINAPSCSYFQCQVQVSIGSNLTVNWLNPTPGLVNVSLQSRDQDQTNTTILPVVSDYPSISQEGYCDAGEGVGVVIPGKECGRIEFLIPSSFPVGMYSVVVQSVNDTSKVGYTDLVKLNAANASDAASSSASGSAVVPSTISLLTISGAPRSTDSANAVSNTYSTPAPTAVSANSSASALSAAQLAEMTSTPSATARSSGLRLDSSAWSILICFLAGRLV